MSKPRTWAITVPSRRNYMQSVGVIRQLARYPVKSMRGEALLSAALTLQGFDEDRRYAFVQAASHSSFLWLTARELPELLYYRTSVERAGSPEALVTVATPHGENWAVGSDELRRVLEARSGRSLFLLRDYRGSYDVPPVSLIRQQTGARIAHESGTKEDSWRVCSNVRSHLTGTQGFS